MAKAISLHVDVSSPDQHQYNRNIRTLVGTHDSAVAMQKVAQTAGFSVSKLLLPQQATAAQLKSEILSAANQLEAGDLFFFTIHCHGESRPDAKEADKSSEYLLLYDKEMKDREFTNYLADFAPGVRIFCLIDACSAGTMIEPSAPSSSGAQRTSSASISMTGGSTVHGAASADELSTTVVTANGATAISTRFATALSANGAATEFEEDTAGEELGEQPNRETTTRTTSSSTSAATVAPGTSKYFCRKTCDTDQFAIAISASTDESVAYDADANNPASPRYTYFTECFLKVWNDGAFRGSYVDLFKALKAELSGYQEPSFVSIAKNIPQDNIMVALTDFELETPLHIPAEERIAPRYDADSTTILKPTASVQTANLQVRISTSASVTPFSPVVLFALDKQEGLLEQAKGTGAALAPTTYNKSIRSIQYTDESGSCEFIGLPLGSYTLLCHDLNNRQYSLQNVELRHAGKNQSVHCLFNRGGIIGSIMIVVVDTGRPLPPTNVYVAPFPPPEADPTQTSGLAICQQTDENGVVRFENLSGEYYAYLWYNGNFHSQQLSVPATGSISHTFYVH